MEAEGGTQATEARGEPPPPPPPTFAGGGAATSVDADVLQRGRAPSGRSSGDGGAAAAAHSGRELRGPPGYARLPPRPRLKETARSKSRNDWSPGPRSMRTTWSEIKRLRGDRTAAAATGEAWANETPPFRARGKAVGASVLGRDQEPLRAMRRRQTPVSHAGGYSCEGRPRDDDGPGRRTGGARPAGCGDRHGRGGDDHGRHGRPEPILRAS